MKLEGSVHRLYALNMRTLLALGVFWLSACCSCPGDTPPPIFVPEESEDTAGGESPPPAPVQRGVDEGRAVTIAMQIAEEEGFDPTLYSDVVVSDGNDHWEVQMRRPRMLRFLLVNVNKDDGASTFQVRSQ